jgi:arabinofuranosyltransferase
MALHRLKPPIRLTGHEIAEVPLFIIHYSLFIIQSTFMTISLLDNRQFTIFKTISLIVLLALFLLVVLRTAFTCGDSYITFRTVDNFVNGYGLRWNVIERVQAYTNPLWLFLLSGFYYFTREIYFTSLTVSIVISLFTVYLVAFQIARTYLAALLVLVSLIGSKAFIDFSTSGLENPLTHLLIALFCLIYLRTDIHQPRTVWSLTLIAALAATNHLDSFLLFIPILIVVFWHNRSWRTVRVMVMGLLPLLLWELFSLVYYGFFLPNTAYAKFLGTGVPREEVWEQGLRYLFDPIASNSVSKDPITLASIALALLVPVLTKQWKLLPLVVGVLLLLAQVVNVGGDFMGGRFLSAPFFTATIILSQLSWSNKIKLLSRLTFVSLGGLATTPTILSGHDYRNFYSHHGIMDVRGRMYYRTGLWRPEPEVEKRNNAERGKALRESLANHDKVFISAAIGHTGFYAGPSVYIIDRVALSDPFLARLPAKRPWAIAHFERVLPEGYLESVQQGKNLIADKKLAELYDQVLLITRGNLFDLNRWRAIAKFHFAFQRELR